MITQQQLLKVSSSCNAILDKCFKPNIRTREYISQTETVKIRLEVLVDEIVVGYLINDDMVPDHVVLWWRDMEMASFALDKGAGVTLAKLIAVCYITRPVVA